MAHPAEPPGKKKLPIQTPSRLPMPVFALCPPTYADNAIKNNPTMNEFKGQKIDRPTFIAQWYNLYNTLAANALVYLITPVRGLQDQTYVNSFMYLPHLENQDVIVLSNFTGEGRAGEEIVAGSLFKDLGYQVVKCPFKFEGEPEEKHVRENIYIGGYGFRSDIRAHQWLESTFGCEIITVKETDEILYHLDCSVLPLGPYNVMMCCEIMAPEEVRQVERIANVIPVSRNDAHEGICNSLHVEDTIYNSSPLQFMSRNDPDYEKQRHKNETLEKIASDLGKELLYFDMQQAELAGAKLSCFVGTLTGLQARY